MHVQFSVFERPRDPDSVSFKAGRDYHTIEV